TASVFAVSNYDQRASPPIVLVAFLVLGHMFGGKIDRIYDCRLASLNIKIIKSIHQQVFLIGEILFRLNLVAADEPHKKSLVAGFGGVNDWLAWVDDALNLRTKRCRSVDSETVANGNFLA